MQHVPDFTHADKETYMITRTPQVSIGNMHFYAGDIGKLVSTLQVKEGKTIFCDGGPEVVHQLLQRNLIDEFVISITPVFTGDGIRLFKDERPDGGLKLLDCKSFETGLVQLRYKRSK